MSDMDPNKIEPSVYKYILKHTKKDQVFLLILTAITMPLAYGALELPKMIINEAISGVDIPEALFGYEMNQVRYLLVLCAAFFLLIVVNGGLNYFYSIYRGIIGEKMLKRFRFDLYARLLRFPLSRFKQVSQAEIIPLITAETQPLGNWIGNSFALPVFQGGLLITYLFFIFNQDVWLGLAAVMLYPPQLYIIPKIQKHINKLDKQRVQSVREFSDRIGEAVSGITDIHSNDMSRFEKAKVTSKLQEIYGIRLDIVKRWFLIKFVNSFLGQLIPFFFYGIGGYFVIKGELSIGALVAVLAAYKDLDTSWRDLLGFYQITENIKVRYSQIIEFFQPSNMMNPALQEEAVPDQRLEGSTIQTTSLVYSEDGNIKPIDGVNFKIESGQHIGLIGHSGSGRSVLAQIIARLLNPSEGSIKISGQNIDQLHQSTIGEKIAYVDQQSFVFNGSLKDNLLYGLRNRAIDDEHAESNSSLLEVLYALELNNEIFQFGLNSRFEPSRHPELADMVLNARRELSQTLEQESYRDLVDELSSDTYNANLSVAENLIFGVPKQVETIEALLIDPRVVKLIEQTGLKETLFYIGLQTAKLMVDMFSDVPEDSPMYSRFSFIHPLDLPIFEGLAKLPDDTKMEAIDDEDVDRIINLAFKIIQARHRLGLITPAIEQQIIETHAFLRQTFGENNDLIEFYDQGRIAQHLSIQDNILFGRVAYGQANAKQKVADLTRKVIDASGQIEKVIELGLDYQVGVGGSNLSSILRQKVTLARALMKAPDILVVNEATAIFESNTEKVLMENILKRMDNCSVIWVLNSTDWIVMFDKLIVLEQGKITAEGRPDEVKHLVNLE